MSFTIQLSCPSCKYDTGGIATGDGERYLAVCSNCSTVVNPERVPFLCFLPNCSKCSEKLVIENVIDDGDLPISYDKGIPSGISCPRCQREILNVQALMHVNRVFSPLNAKEAPKRGQLVHAIYDRVKKDCYLVGTTVEVQLTNSEDFEPGEPDPTLVTLWEFQSKLKISDPHFNPETPAEIEECEREEKMVKDYRRRLQEEQLILECKVKRRRVAFWGREVKSIKVQYIKQLWKSDL